MRKSLNSGSKITTVWVALEDLVQAWKWSAQSVCGVGVRTTPLDIYNHYESLDSTNDEYKTSKASEDYVKWENGHLDGSLDCVRMIKLDCIGHIQKCL